MMYLVTAAASHTFQFKTAVDAVAKATALYEHRKRVDLTREEKRTIG